MTSVLEAPPAGASHLGRETRCSPGLWAQYAAATLGQWLRTAVSGTDVIPLGAGYWIDRTGPLSDGELSAMRTLAASGESLTLTGSQVMAIARQWTPGSLPSASHPHVSHALEALAPRVQQVFAAAAPLLDAWGSHVLAAVPPPWFQLQRDALRLFMGGEGKRTTRLALLPTGPDQNGQLWRAFIGMRHKGLLCGGPPAIPDALWEDLLHTTAHAAQRIRLEPLMEDYLTTPHGQQLATACEETPYATWLRTIPGVGPSAIRDVVRETVIHSLVYQGALRTTSSLPPLDNYWREIARTSHAMLSQREQVDKRGTPYTAWVLGGCAAIQPLLQRYLDDGRALDPELMHAVFATFQALYDRWRAVSPN